MATSTLIGVTTAAAELGIDARLVRRYCEAGRLEAERIDGRWVIWRDSLREFAKKPRPRGRPRSNS